MRILLISFLVLFLLGPAEAQDSDSLATNEPGTALADQPDTRIEVDESAEVIRFVIGGRERAVLDAMGFHVEGDVGFTGTLVDTGGDQDQETE